MAEKVEKLTDKDLHCIARQLQSAWRAPEQKSIDTYRMFYGCWYCKYSHSCKEPATIYFKRALRKLSELTGVNVECIFFPGMPLQDIPPGIYIYRIPGEIAIFRKTSSGRVSGPKKIFG